MMEFRNAILLLTLSALVSEAKVSIRRTPKEGNVKALQVQAKISPELEPSSDSKFMKKDLPWDKRPSAEALHFKHPYPIVQDSGDYDADYVKDENSDNGNWKAQETYDRLRMKLAKEKRDLATAKVRQDAADKELEDTRKAHDQRARDRAEAERRKRALEAGHAAEDAQKDKDKAAAGGTGAGGAGGQAEENPWVPKKAWLKPLLPGPGDKDVDAATAKTKGAVDKLEDCKKQLEEARKRLKELMEELEAAKKAQADANAALDDLASKEQLAEHDRDSIKKQVKEQYKDYLAAKKAYEDQLALIAKLEAEIKIAAQKVRDMRNAEDPNGGVYNTHDEKSSVVLATAPKLLVLALLGLVASW